MSASVAENSGAPTARIEQLAKELYELKVSIVDMQHRLGVVLDEMQKLRAQHTGPARKPRAEDVRAWLTQQIAAARKTFRHRVAEPVAEAVPAATAALLELIERAEPLPQRVRPARRYAVAGAAFLAAAVASNVIAGIVEPKASVPALSEKTIANAPFADMATTLTLRQRAITAF